MAAVLAEEAETWAGDNRDVPVAKVLDDEKDETEKVKIKMQSYRRSGGSEVSEVTDARDSRNLRRIVLRMQAG